MKFIAPFTFLLAIASKQGILGSDAKKLLRSLSNDDDDTKSYMETRNYKKSAKDDEDDDNKKQGLLLASGTLNLPLSSALEEDKEKKVSVKSLNRFKELMQNMNELVGKFGSATAEMEQVLKSINNDKEKEKGSERLDLRIIEVDNDKKKENRE